MNVMYAADGAKISVIIPVYNTGEKLLKCVDSVIKQTHNDFELILVDDGSEDETAHICEQLKREDDRISVFHQHNSGVSEARNFGIAKANGKWLYFMDSDDYIDLDMLETMIHAAEGTNSDLVICGYYDEVAGKREEAVQNLHPYECICGRTQIQDNLIDLWNCSLMYNIWNKLFLREKVKEHQIRFPKGKAFNEDRDFVRSYLFYTEKILVLDRCLYHYIREDRASAAGKYRENKLEIRKKEYEDLRDFFEKMEINTPQAQEYVAREHFDRVVGCVEELFHYPFSFRDRYIRIKRMLKDEYSVEVCKNSRPKSKMMKMIRMVYATHSTMLVYIMTYNIYLIRNRYPELFYKLRQRR